MCHTRCDTGPWLTRSYTKDDQHLLDQQRCVMQKITTSIEMSTELTNITQDVYRRFVSNRVYKNLHIYKRQQKVVLYQTVKQYRNTPKLCLFTFYSLFFSNTILIDTIPQNINITAKPLVLCHFLPCFLRKKDPETPRES